MVQTLKDLFNQFLDISDLEASFVKIEDFIDSCPAVHSNCFCQTVQENLVCAEKCKYYSSQIINTQINMSEPYFFTCHAGLTVGGFIYNSKHLGKGYVFSMPVRVWSRIEDMHQHANVFCEIFSFDKECFLREYVAMPYVDSVRLQLCTEILRDMVRLFDYSLSGVSTLSRDYESSASYDTYKKMVTAPSSTIGVGSSFEKLLRRKQFLRYIENHEQVLLKKISNGDRSEAYNIFCELFSAALSDDNLSVVKATAIGILCHINNRIVATGNYPYTNQFFSLYYLTLQDVSNATNKTTIEMSLDRYFAQLYFIYYDTEKSRTYDENAIVVQIFDYLTVHYFENITLDLLASELKYSRDHISRVFKQATGITIMNYLMRIRMNAANELLANTELPVNMVMRRVGYSDLTAFGRNFKKYYGMTPIEFRHGNKKRLKFSVPDR